MDSAPPDSRHVLCAETLQRTEVKQPQIQMCQATIIILPPSSEHLQQPAISVHYVQRYASSHYILVQATAPAAAFASSMATKAGLVYENCTIMSKRRWQAQRPDMLCNLGSPIGRRRLSKGILLIIRQNLTVQ